VSFEIPFSFEAMHWKDVPTVMTIEQRSFTLPWSANTYRHEIMDNANAYYFVLRYLGEPPGRVNSWLSRLTQREPASQIVGYGGFWFIVDEAHISTIAIDLGWRGRGLGEYLLASLIGRALELKAASVTLEVREMNLVAQNLYRKYGFVITGKRPHYYQDNNENAFLMTVDGVDQEAYRQTFKQQTTALRERLARTVDQLSVSDSRLRR